MREIVIVGGVAAGMSCAAKLKRESDDVKITVYEKGDIVSYGACGLPYYIGDDIKDSDRLIVKRPEDFEEDGISVNILHEVMSIDAENKLVRVKNLSKDEKFEKKYDELVIATGSSPIIPPFVGFNVNNIFNLRTIDDGKRIKAAAQKEEIKDVVIVGGGYIGIELVEAFYKLGKNVSVINRSPRIMGSLDQEIRDVIIEELNDKQINLYLYDEVSEIKVDENGNVKAVITNQGEYQADLVVVAIGVKPNTEIAKDAGIKTMDNGAILIDEKMRTNIQGIYAAGDCTALYHMILEDHVYIPLATYANRQGRMLAEIIAGKEKSFLGGIGSSVVKVLDLEVSQTGLNEHQAKTGNFEYDTVFIKGRSHAGYYPGAQPIYIKLVFEKDTKRVLGGQLVGKKGAALRINSLALAVQNKMSLEEIAYSDFAYSPPFSGSWDPIQVAANVGISK